MLIARQSGWRRDVPRQQRLVVVGGLRTRQRLEQGNKIGVAVDVVGFSRFHQRVQIGRGLGAGHGIAE